MVALRIFLGFMMGFAVSVNTLSSAVHAAEPGCVFAGAKLDCSDGRKKNKWSQITRAFASEKTRQLLSEPLDELDRFDRPIDREHFRVSVEHSWEAVNQYDRYSRDQLKLNAITPAEYRRRVAVRQDALKSYRAAYWFYKNLNWQSDR